VSILKTLLYIPRGDITARDAFGCINGAHNVQAVAGLRVHVAEIPRA